MRRLLLLSAMLLTMSACAMPPHQTRTIHHHAPTAASQRDQLECLAIASQAANGAGAWSSSAPIGAAFYQHAKNQYYVQCLQSRGY